MSLLFSMLVIIRRYAMDVDVANRAIDCAICINTAISKKMRLCKLCLY